MEKTTSDKIGITASVLCLIHCLAIPILFTVSADTLHLVNHQMPIIDYIFAVVALIAAYFSGRKTTDTKIKIAFGIGWALFIIGVLLHDNPYLLYLLHIGSVILIVTHLKNIRNCRVKLPKPKESK
ncbi:MAG: MerC domain-containing protein [Candidatus Kapaibacterium sp.]|nr:MerC domain-containing protein [Ignavibacteriota bacterium]MCB9222014.1 MerC domain-containing protein [Ignavibacteria bacterium]